MICIQLLKIINSNCTAIGPVADVFYKNHKFLNTNNIKLYITNIKTAVYICFIVEASTP
jgi:hypothetical protein